VVEIYRISVGHASLPTGRETCVNIDGGSWCFWVVLARLDCRNSNCNYIFNVHI
jgi:hypothetical protein